MTQVREIININVGQAGCQLGHIVWQQYNAEHSVEPNKEWKPDDQLKKTLKNENETVGEEQRKDASLKAQTFYEMTNTNLMIPRNFFIDLEASCIQQIKKGALGKQFQDDY